jgi:hypothetical protein
MYGRVVARWDRPDDSVVAAMEARLRDEEQRVGQAVQVRHAMACVCVCGGGCL